MIALRIITVLNYLAVAPLIYVVSVVDTAKRAMQEINKETQNIYIGRKHFQNCSTNCDILYVYICI